ncbi:endo-1,4-beta xylanase [Pluteus cervinus]|uniref:Endo-1,4-beta xylanase n=1 Tax=Pluteus cervinus TaxID=181527 RepID=A0ACD3A368_9AGAR|nr:endo-1,4-beta xylanase [Pluteus cervinus]
MSKLFGAFLVLLPLVAGQLNRAAKEDKKLYFGSATDNPEWNDTEYVRILSNTANFGQLTPANSMKWDATEPEPGVFNFTGGDQVVQLAERNGQIMRGHNCVWYNQLPDWVSSGTFTNASLLNIVENHCSTIVNHWRGKIWDVINEPFNDDGTFRETIFFNVTGTAYIPAALRAARAADPHAKLYINDYNLEEAGPKATAMINLVTALKSQGVPVDGIGVQGHLFVGEVPDSLESNLQAFTALGVEVAITELDIRMTLPATEALLEQQKQDYFNVISTCKGVSGCVGVTLWDYTDKFSWVPGAFPGQGAACPWDENLNIKPAFFGILDSWQ